MRVYIYFLHGLCAQRLHCRRPHMFMMPNGPECKCLARALISSMGYPRIAM